MCQSEYKHKEKSGCERATNNESAPFNWSDCVSWLSLWKSHIPRYGLQVRKFLNLFSLCRHSPTHRLAHWLVGRPIGRLPVIPGLFDIKFPMILTPTIASQMRQLSRIRENWTCLEENDYLETIQDHFHIPSIPIFFKYQSDRSRNE